MQVAPHKRHPIQHKAVDMDSQQVLTSFRNTHSSCYNVGNTQPKDTEAVNSVSVHTEDPNHIGPSVLSQHKRTHQNSLTISSIDEARVSKRARLPTATGRSMSVGRANRRIPTVARAITDGCSSGHSAAYECVTKQFVQDPHRLTITPHQKRRTMYKMGIGSTIRVVFAATVGWEPFVDASLMLVTFADVSIRHTP
ncbi:hypothetical protein Tco_1142792 [Tanacetum coccineum]